MVYNRLAYSLIIKGSIEFWDKEKLTYRPLFPELYATSVVAWKRQQPFGVAAEKFIEYIKRYFENLLDFKKKIHTITRPYAIIKKS